MSPTDSNNGQRTHEENTLSYIVRKSEKLTTALYMISDILSDKEPLKWMMREGAVELLSDMTIAATSGRSEQMTALRNALKKIERVASFLDIAGSAKMISEMNAGILKKEYLALKDAVESAWTTVHADSKQVFPQNFFDVPRLASRPTQDIPQRASSSAPTVQQGSAQVKQEEARRAPEPAPVQATARPELHQSRRENTGHREAVSHQSAETQPRPQAPVGHHNPFIRANTPNSHQGQTHKPFAAALAGSEFRSPRSPLENLNLRGEERDGTRSAGLVESFSEQGERKDPTSGQLRYGDLDEQPARSEVAALGVADNQQRPPVLGQPLGNSDLRVARQHTQPQSQSPSYNKGVGGNDDRRKIILALVKQKPSLTVGDVARSIPSVSEKTIQRELLAMVAEGILAKRGERRWSTYSLR
jgi:hypothetical protein